MGVVVLACVTGWLLARRTLGYKLEGCTTAADGTLTATADRGGAIAFEDGSRILLDKDARVQLKALAFKRGVEVALRDGEATLAVVHRLSARWAVLAGPFRVDVTGTRFAVKWSPSSERFRVVMSEGHVRVSGGSLSTATPLRAGQTLRGTASSLELTDLTDQREVSPQAPRSEAEARPRQELLAKTDTIPPRPGRRAPSSTPPRRRAGMSAEADTARKGIPAARTSSLGADGNKATTLNEPPAPSGAGESAPAGALESWPAFAAQTERAAPKTGPNRVTIDTYGQLNGGFNGFAWVETGEGTTLSDPASWEGRTHLQTEDGLLCASGTVAALSCVNEGMPQVSCNWARNWGVAIGWSARADKKAWGIEATSAIAVEFRGRSSSYRLNVHRKDDPPEKMYCIENYKSGQVVRPAMFKSKCWSDTGVSLSDFEGVDLFNLQFASGMNYVAFRYCITGITVYR